MGGFLLMYSYTNFNYHKSCSYIQFFLVDSSYVIDEDHFENKIKCSFDYLCSTLYMKECPCVIGKSSDTLCVVILIRMTIFI